LCRMNRTVAGVVAKFKTLNIPCRTNSECLVGLLMDTLFSRHRDDCFLRAWQMAIGWIGCR
jgi:hypothetical protein